MFQCLLINKWKGGNWMQLDNNLTLECMQTDQKHLYLEACAEDLIYQIHDFCLSYEQSIDLLERVGENIKKEQWG
jgi:hypothetical protein